MVPWVVLIFKIFLLISVIEPVFPYLRVISVGFLCMNSLGLYIYEFPRDTIGSMCVCLYLYTERDFKEMAHEVMGDGNSAE